MRSRILVAARGLVLDHGTTAFTMAELADAADVALVTPYNHFDSKAGVLNALLDLEGAQTQVAERIAKASSEDGLELTLAFGESRARRYLADAPLYRPVFKGLLGFDPAAEDHGSQRGSWVQLWQQGLLLASAAGDLAVGVETAPVARSLQRQFNVLLRDWALGHIDDQQFAPETRYAITLLLSAVVSEELRPDWVGRVIDAQAGVAGSRSTPE